MIFSNTLEDNISAVESYLVDAYDVVVDYDPMGLDEYWIDDNVITINTLKDKQHQLFVLLHEAGHVVLRSRDDFEEMFPGIKTSRVEVLKEEIMAWEEARKLANNLSIDLGEHWNAHVRQAIMKYVRWVQV
tara:strand:- start:907 stop:1299 length:393 start_codon:yes stop_codon:yes gene_type:complete